MRASVQVVVGIRWWVMPYLNTVVFFCYAFGGYPDLNRVLAVVEKGIYVRVKNRR